MVWVRGSFFTVYLIALAADCEEFQVTRFILGLKGSQFISGIFKLLTVCIEFWSCSVTVPEINGCAANGPGVGRSTVRDILILLWLQVLLWIAFLLLPYSGQFDASRAKVDFSRARKLWAQAQQESAGTAPGAKPGPPRRVGFVTKLPSRLFSAVPQSLSRILSVGGPSATSLPLPASLPSPAGSGLGSGGYIKLEDATTPTGKPLSDEVKESDAREETVGAVGCVWAALERLRSTIMAVTYPMRTGASKNRLLLLLRFDTRAFLACAALFTLMSLVSVHAEVGGSWATACLALAYKMGVSGDFWLEWQTQITFAVVKLVFMLSSLPFFVFTIGGLSTLFTHTDATAYTRAGRVVNVDPNGLSSYLAWLKQDVLGVYGKFAKELSDPSRFPPRAMHKLRWALKDGEDCLVSAWCRPATAVRVTRANKVEIDQVLSKVVTTEAASPELYAFCFPDTG